MKHLKNWWPVYAGIFTVSIIILLYVITTNTNLPKLSSKRQDWNEMAEFVGFIVNPVIGIVGAYLILHTIFVQNDMKLVDRYCLRLDSLTVEITRLPLYVRSKRYSGSKRYSANFQWLLIEVIIEIQGLKDEMPEKIKTKKGLAIVNEAFSRVNSKLLILFLKEKIIKRVDKDDGLIFFPEKENMFKEYLTTWYDKMKK